MIHFGNVSMYFFNIFTVGLNPFLAIELLKEFEIKVIFILYFLLFSIEFK